MNHLCGLWALTLSSRLQLVCFWEMPVLVPRVLISHPDPQGDHLCHPGGLKVDQMWTETLHLLSTVSETESCGVSSLHDSLQLVLEPPVLHLLSTVSETESCGVSSLHDSLQLVLEPPVPFTQ